MNKSNNETVIAKVLDVQQESASENEESGSITDQSSSLSESATRGQSNGKYAQTAKHATASATTTSTATQFSVQRSDTDGLRMKISAIRPANYPIAAVKNTRRNSISSSNNLFENKAAINTLSETTNTKTPKIGDKINNNTITKSVTHKVKRGNNKEKQLTAQLQTQEKEKSRGSPQKKQQQQQQQLQRSIEQHHPKEASTNMSTHTNPANVIPATVNKSITIPNISTAKAAPPTLLTRKSETTTLDALNKITLPSNLMPPAPCLSDATESGCSEATTTTIAAGNEKTPTTKKIKVKRKKAQSKCSDTKKTSKKTAARSQIAAAFSSDSEEEPLRKHAPQHLQRAPRLLLTAINLKSSVPQLKSLSNALVSSSVTPAHGSDNIGLSSSDNELPDLVKAAIKRVESDTDDTGEGFRKAKSKNLPQYQSTLLQDFMEKTQMLGQTPARIPSPAPEEAQQQQLSKLIRADLLATNLNSNSQTESIASSNSVSKKRRGRPKKPVETESLSATNTISVSTINESADSGVISTTSTTQSTSPLPKTSIASTIAASTSQPVHQKHKKHDSVIMSTTTSPSKSNNEATNIAALNLTTATTTAATTSLMATKPKIDIAYLDKRMYATERVLYPPPRNKRRQSTSAASLTPSKSTQQETRKTIPSTKTTKEELQLDPIWRKIDVNKKFRRPSVSGYKSDGGGGNTTICSKILAAKSGYVSDYGSFHPRSHHHHNSGYKSDASAKSRYSTKSCASRRSRAKSCGYRSDCKDSAHGASLKSTKFRRKRRCALMKAHSKSVGNLNDEQDILQLAGLSLGQSSEESNEYVCKPSLEKLPTTSVSKKYGEINRFIATGEYFGRGNSGSSTFAGLQTKRICDTTNEDNSQDGYSQSFCSGKLLLQHKNSLASELTHEMLPHVSRKIKSRRSSIASYCSSYYSSTSKVKRKRRRKSFRFPSSGNKCSTIDSKLLTEIEIITNTFATLCRIHSNDKSGNSLSGKEKQLLAEANKIQSVVAAASTSSKRESRDKRTLKKRKIGENLDFALLSASVGNLTPSGGGGGSSGGGSTKRRHKKASSSSPDDHKLPLKKRHYLLTPGEKSTEVAVAVAAKLFANKTEAWAAAAAAAKSSVTTKSQQQYGSKSKAAVTPKKRHLLQNATHSEESSSLKGSNTSPLRIVVDTTSITGSKLLDISPISLGSLKQASEVVHKKRSRLEGLVSKIANHSDEQAREANKTVHKTTANAPQLDSETSCPPPGVFEPSVELEIQIPPMTKLTETSTSIITKSEVDSPLLMDLNKSFSTTSTKVESTRVVETLLNKTGGNLILKRKRKKFNRTGFPTMRRKKRKINENLLLDFTPDISEQVHKVTAASMAKGSNSKQQLTKTSDNICDRVPQAGETSDTFLERANRTPRLSVVALERLQGTPPTTPTTSAITTKATISIPSKEKSREKKRQTSAKHKTETMEETPKVNKKSKVIRKEATPTETPATVILTTTTTTKTPTKNTATTTVVEDKSSKPTVRARSRAHANKNILNDSSNLEQTKEETNMAKPNKKVPTPIAKIGKPTAATTSTTTTTTTSVLKSLAQKIITAKTFESKVKLPAGIDPNTNFRCKIRLKRRNSVHPNALGAANITAAATTATTTTTITPLASTRAPEDIEAEAAAKDAQINQPEHDILPQSDANGLDSEGASDTSDEKSSSTSTATTLRKVGRLKKAFIPAGLFSNYFKYEHSQLGKSMLPPRRSEKKDTSINSPLTKATILALGTGNEEANIAETIALLPPPPYCEKFFRRTELDFCLPYDIWWAYKNSKLPTRITVPSWNYRKIRTNIYAESVRPNTVGIDHPTCTCKADVGCGENCLNRMVYTECSPSNCPTREKCRNQKIHRHEVAPGVERFMTENKGWGVRTKLPIKKGTYILEYVGEVVTEREFKDRMGTFYLNDTHHYCLHLDGGLVIDGHRMGSDGRFVNHSCQPNCEMQKWSVNGLSRMALFAKRNIEEGEELTYDYNFSLFNPSEGQPCRCNTPQCRGVIGGKSQRVKPLPIETKPIEASPKEVRNGRGRQRKRKALKNTQRLLSKDIVVARVQQLSEKEKKMVKQHGVFLVRNFEKIRRCKAKKGQNSIDVRTPTPSPTSPNTVTPAAINNRRPSTPSSLAVQISALCSPRSIKTRGLTLAVQDPEVEKMAKVAVILRDICASLENLKDNIDEKTSLASLALITANSNRKKKTLKAVQKQNSIDLKKVQANIEQGYYKQPTEFDNDMQKIFTESKQANKADVKKNKALETIITAYENQKAKSYAQLLELVNDESILRNFRDQTKSTDAEKKIKLQQNAHNSNAESKELTAAIATATKSNAEEESLAITEDIIRCICGLYKDEGLMIQCARCMVWQHTECTKADINAESYLCEKCEPRKVNREIPLEDFTEEGHRYYLTLMRGDLHVRQGDAVYVLRDIPIKDPHGNVVPTKKHTYETIGDIDFNECDIFRVERLWKNEEGKRFIFGHHFLRPHETFHEPSRRFYPNEVVRVPLYEVVPIELVIGRCWVLDRTTFCKGRPTECNEEEHCYICELRVDKSARFFSKAKVNYPICTKSYAFRKFAEKLKISKTYAPHDVDPAMLKTKKQKTDNEAVAATTAASPTMPSSMASARQDINKTPLSAARKRQGSNSPATVHLISPVPPTVQIIKKKRARLENVLKAMKLKHKNTQKIAASVTPIDLSYLLSGRGARQRKTLAAAAAAAATVSTLTTSSSSMVPIV